MEQLGDVTYTGPSVGSVGGKDTSIYWLDPRMQVTGTHAVAYNPEKALGPGLGHPYAFFLTFPALRSSSLTHTHMHTYQ